MNTTTRTYTIAKQRQLIDLNGAITNFDLTFTATSKDSKDSKDSKENKTFNIIVVDQDKIDSKEFANMVYKTVNSSISGNIVSDKNIHKNYYLCLKADEQCEVEIKIEITEIKPRVAPRIKSMTPPMPPIPKKSYLTTKNISLFCVIVIGVGLLWYFYFQKKEGVDTTVSETVSEISPSTESTTESTSTESSGLLSKMRNLSM